jgi:WYL domain
VCARRRAASRATWRYLDVAGEEPDGRLRATVAAQSTTAVAEQLAGWATLIEVVGPREVVSELARIGAELVERYGA